MKNGKLSHLIVATYLTFTVGNTSLVYADDTEIYLNSAASAGAANILFNLDTSGSMSTEVDENNDGDIDPGERSRMEVLREAMLTVLDSLPPINAGIMRYHYYGGPILYPVSPLDEFACVIEGNCTTATATTGIVSTTNVITSGDDDVELEDGVTMILNRVALDMGQRAGGSCTTVSGEAVVEQEEDTAESDRDDSGYVDDSSDLEIPREGSEQQIVGVRFQDVDIPKDATITDARINFVVNQVDLAISQGYIRPIDILITGENMSGTRVEFDDPNDEPEDRVADNPTSAVVDWETGEFPGIGSPLVTSNIAAILNELVSDPAWPATGGDDMVFIFGEDPGKDVNSTGSRELESYSSSNTALNPKLTYTYQTCTSPTGTNMRTGLRFTDIDVPQGSTVTAARIDFITTTVEAGTNPVFAVKVQDADDAEPFAVGVPFTGRTFTSAATWDGSSSPALTDWSPVDTTYSTPDLTTQVQTIINRTGWCGGNDMMFMIERSGGDSALRSAYSYEGDSDKMPILTLTFDADSNPSGCSRTTVVKLLSGTNNDAEEIVSSGEMDATSTDLEMVDDGGDDQIVGMRFNDIPIAQGATIEAAKIVFTADEDDTTSTSLTFRGQKSGNARIFTTADDNLSDTTERPKTSASVSWSPGAFSFDGEIHDSPELKTIIQEIVNEGDWEPGNALALFVTGSGKRVAQSFDRNPAAAPRLIITFEGTAVNGKKTVRGRMKGIIEELTQASGTPIAGSMLEAAYYFRGENVVFGRQRGTQSSSYRVSRVSHAASYDAGGSSVTYPGDCSVDNLNHEDCKDQVISGGTPVYKSPIVSECQANYLVNLTDGGGYYTGDGLSNTQSQSIDEEDLIEAMVAGDPDNPGSTLTLGTCDTPTTYDGITFSGSEHNECTVKLAKFLHENDQIYTSSQNLQSGTAPIDDVQSLDIYTIGFNLCDLGDVTAVDDVTNESICCAVADSTDNGDGTRSCSSPVTDPEKIKVLKAQAGVAGGKYFNANTVDELVAAFQTITNDILQKDTSFVAPSIAANAFNRLFSRDEVYFGLFEPAEQPRWDGNVKKYTICTNPDEDGVPGNGDDCTLGDVLDANGDGAIFEAANPDDPEDGLFDTGAQSVWSGVIDGRSTRLGGAGGAITDHAERLVYTEYNGSTAAAGEALSNTGFFLDSANWDSADTLPIRDQVCADPNDTSAGSDCELRMLWMLGKNTFGDAVPPALSVDTRWWFQDVLHSSPVAVTYGQEAAAPFTFIDKVIVGTNDGGLHFINGSTGEEEWVFMPRATLNLQPALYDNTVPDHIYGIDSTPLIITNDVNLNGEIDPATDSVKVVVSQRRGGENIYALDITPTAKITSDTTLDEVVPKFLWHISSATPGFTQLGQTWSEPQLVKLATSSGAVEALVFGGGYDPDLDDDDGSGTAKNFGAEGGAPNSGNAIYIVNAATGDLLFSVNGDSGTDAGNIYVPQMQFAIPSNVNVFDSDGDGFEDRLYVGDTAGQLFRVDLIDVDPTANDSTKGKGDSVVGILANVSTAGTLIRERRFFYRPTVVQVIDTEFSDAAGGEYDYVLIGSGNRANPLDTEVKDRFYAFRDVNIGPMVDANSNNIADSYPQNIDATANGGPILDNGANAELIDVSVTTLDPTNAAIQSALGWFFDFNTAAGSPAAGTGEKVLAGSSVFQNTLVFTTYVPDDISLIQDPCKAAEGSGLAYNFNILSTAAALDWDSETDPDASDPDADAKNLNDNRSSELGSGIPSEAVPIFTAEGVTVLVGTGGGAQNLGKVAELPRFSTYWYEEY